MNILRADKMRPLIQEVIVALPVAPFKNLYLSSNDSFLKKSVPKQVFSACENGAFFSVLDFFGKMLNFVGMWCPSHLSYTNSWGINGKIISISFIWDLLFWNVATGKATMTS